MGFYLSGPTKGKVDQLIATQGAERISRPPECYSGVCSNECATLLNRPAHRDVDRAPRRRDEPVELAGCRGASRH